MANKSTARFKAYSKLDFTQPEDSPNGLPITGFAIHEGRFKEVINISKEEFANIERTMQNVQLRIDHGESVRDVVGKVHIAQSEFDSVANKPGVFYKAFIDDTEIAGKVQKNLVNDVSIGFDLYPECSVCGEDFRTCEHWFDEAHINAKDMDVFELSIVTRGADADAKASAQNFKAQFNDKKENLDKIKDQTQDSNQINFTEGGKSMVDKTPDKVVDFGEIVTKLSDSEQKAANEAAARAKAEGELKAKEAEMKKLQKELKDAQDAKTDLESKHTDLEEKFNSTSTKLNDQELDTKKTEVLSIVEEKLSKDLITEEQKEAEIETLMKVDDLQPIKDLVAQFDKKEANPDRSKLNEIQNSNKKTGQAKTVDYDKLSEDPKFVQAMVHEIFKYDRVFAGERKEQTPSKSYMGLRRNNLDGASVNL